MIKIASFVWILCGALGIWSTSDAHKGLGYIMMVALGMICFTIVVAVEEIKREIRKR
jgi:hypothetical protein